MSQTFRLYDEKIDTEEDPSRIPFQFVLYYGNQRKDPDAEAEFNYIMPSQLLHYASASKKTNENFLKQLFDTKNKDRERLELYCSKENGKKVKPSVFKSTAVLVSEYKVPDKKEVIINGFATFNLSIFKNSANDEIIITSVCADKKFSKVFEGIFQFFQEACIYDCSPIKKDVEDDDENMDINDDKVNKTNDDDDDNDEDEDEDEDDDSEHPLSNTSSKRLQSGGKKVKIIQIRYLCDYRCQLHDLLTEECDFVTKDSKEYVWKVDFEKALDKEMECRRKYFYKYKLKVEPDASQEIARGGLNDVIGYITGENKIVFFDEKQKQKGILILVGDEILQQQQQQQQQKQKKSSNHDDDDDDDDDPDTTQKNNDHEVSIQDLDIIELPNDSTLG